MRVDFSTRFFHGI